MVQLGQALLHHRVFLKPERYAGRAPPEAVFNLLFRRHQQQFPDFRRGLQRGNVHIKQEVEPGISRAAQDAALRLVPGDVDGQLLLAAFEHADDPAFGLQSVEQVLKRFLVPPGQIKETDQIVEAHGMTDFAHQPQHLLSVQPAGDAHERLFVVIRCCLSIGFRL